MSEKRYLRGVAKEAPFSNDGEYINFSLNVEEVTQLASGEWINLAIRRRREADMYGNTHSVLLNDYDGSKAKAKPAANNTKPETKAFEANDDGAPF